jgi:uncharacterized membrane protein
MASKVTSHMPHSQAVFAALGVLLLGLGWPLARRLVPPNRWYGLRVPATFRDEQVWYDANAAAGSDMMALGAVVSAVALVLPYLVRLQDNEYAGICAAVLGIGSLLLAVRGWRLANRLLRKRREEGNQGQAGKV